MKAWGVEKLSDSVFLCDDDNDMELAVEVGKAFLPSISSVSLPIYPYQLCSIPAASAIRHLTPDFFQTNQDSVRAAILSRPDHFVVAKAQDTDATEEMIDAVYGYFGLSCS